MIEGREGRMRKRFLEGMVKYFYKKKFSAVK